MTVKVSLSASVSSNKTSPSCSPDIFTKLKGVVRVYSLISAPATPTINNLVPSLLNFIPPGVVSCEETLMFPTKEALDTSKPVESVYSLISLPWLPVTNILVPSLLNTKPLGKVSWELISKLSTKDAVAVLNALAKVYSLTSLPPPPVINIFVPSLLNANPWGEFSWEATLKLLIKDAVDTSKPVERLYA